MRKSLALAAVALAPGCWPGCAPRNQYAPPPPPAVTVAQPVQKSVGDYVELTGTTQATAKVDLRARVNGYLRSIEFQDGATVEKGALLFVIEPEPFRVELERTEADLEKAEASLKLAEAEVERTSALLKRNAASRQELDVDLAERSIAAATVASAKAAIRDARLKLDYTEIRAPIGGRIGRHLVDVGNLVQAELSLLATIEAYDPIYVYFTISERQALYFARLREQKILPPLDPGSIVLKMGLGDEEGFPHEGKFDFAENGVDPETGTTLRRGIFPNPGGAVVPGLFARIRAAVGEPSPRLLVPERAIGSDQQGRYVLVVNEKNVVEYRPITPGIKSEGLRVIDKGLKPDEWVVVNGLLRARPGATVDPEKGNPLDYTASASNRPKPKDAPDTPKTAEAPAEGRPSAPAGG